MSPHHRQYRQYRESKDLQSIRALNWVNLPGQVKTGRARWNTSAPCKSNGHWIGVAETEMPYGRSLHTSAYLTHAVKGILLAWKDGVLVDSQIRWRCGSRSRTFVLLNEPTSVICPLCTIVRLPRER